MIIGTIYLAATGVTGWALVRALAIEHQLSRVRRIRAVDHWRGWS